MPTVNSSIIPFKNPGFENSVLTDSSFTFKTLNSLTEYNLDALKPAIESMKYKV
ncbi:hypothetical protein NUACC21_78900 [Scytonema sp. NUACC21]